MKQRLLVMNGSRIVQSEQDGQWRSEKVDKAGTLKPGIYNLYLASRADKTATSSGVIVHADKDNVYQQVGRNFPVREILGHFEVELLLALVKGPTGVARVQMRPQVSK